MTLFVAHKILFRLVFDFLELARAAVCRKQALKTRVANSRY
jgi:hypothetical protein